ncbi:NAD(P)H-quinone oxidoreductase subunit 4L chloroplastic [Bienertia sinuspersici]
MILEYVLVLSAFLFSIGIFGLVTSRNLVRALIRQLKGNIFSIFVIAIAAAEAAIGPAIVSSIYRNRKSTRINQSNLLNK